MQADWVSTYADVATAVIALVAAILVVWQVRETRHAANATAFKVVYDILQAEYVRAARRVVMEELLGRDFNAWSDEEKKQAEIVCQSYNTVGMMAKYKYISMDLVASEWCDSVSKCWEVLGPFVESYQAKRGRTFWDSFERLSRHAARFK